MNDQSFFEFLTEGKLMGSRCSACGVSFVPPRVLCPDCHQDDSQWVAMSGSGKLAAFTSISIGPPWMVEQGFDRKNPYCTGVVQLDEGPRVVARIENVDAQHPEDIKVGTPLSIKFVEQPQGDTSHACLIFVPR